MLTVERHGPVTRLHFAGLAGRLAGYTVSAYAVRGALVDTGFHGARGDLARWLDANPVRGALVTHWHEDHAGNVELLARRSVPLAMADATRARVRDVRPIGPYRRLVWRQMPALATEASDFADDLLRLVPTPGHSDDHHAVWDEATGTLFAGDLFLGVRVRVAHAGERPRETARSLRRAAALGPAHMFCAHRGPVPEPQAALVAKAEWHEQVIGEIDRLVDAGWDDRAICRAVLGGESVVGLLSAGEYARMNFVRVVRATR